ncbi:hypothetical protein JCM8547_001856 [Rhodosporidiobolus lusitaniae]
MAAATAPPSDAILLEFQPPFAIITFNQPQKKNALDSTLYQRLSSILQQVDRRSDVFITVVTGKGDFFSAGADVKAAREGFLGEDARIASLGRLSESNMDLTRSFYNHSKILVAGLNGPAIGLSAALLGHFDFVYAVENAYFLTPFAAISLVAEGGASLSLVQRMGIAKANEALIMGKKLSVKELLPSGFVTGLFPPSSAEVFRASLLKTLEEQFDGLELESCVGIKKLIRQAQPNPEETNVREVFAGAERFATGKPQARFSQLAAKKMRHKI